MADDKQYNILASIRASASEFNSDIKAIQRDAKEFEKSIKPMTGLMNDLGAGMTGFGKGLTAALTLPIAGLGVVATKAASDFESSFAGVRKTVDATEEEFAKLSAGFREMSTTIPVSVNELNKIGESAGQLGIHKEDILSFTKTMADLAATTNLTSDEAATATAQIQNIFGKAGKDTDRFGATLVALGNAGASTEKDIIAMSLRIAGAGTQVGLTQAQTLSFASALSSVGINAEAGGSAMSKVFLKINDAVANGGGSLNEFARIAGTSSKAFKASFETDAAGATTEFIAGLGRLKAQGENVNATLEGVVGKNIILKDTLLRASGAGDMLADTVRLGTQAWQDNTALVDEAKKRYETFDSQMHVFMNRLNDVAISLGQALLPVLTSLLEYSGPLIDFAASAAKWFADLPGPVQLGAIAFAAMAAAAGPVLLVLGSLTTGLSSTMVMYAKIEPLVIAVNASMIGTGAAATAAAVGAVALSAGVGILIGSLVNWAISGTRVEKALDGVMTEIMAYEKYAGQMIDTTTKAAAVLKDKYGITIDKNNKSIEEWNKQVTEALRQQIALDPKIQANIVSLGKESAARKIVFEELERTIPSLEKQKEALEKQKEAIDADEAATKKLSKSVESLKKSFTDDHGESIFIRTLNEINRSGGLTGDVLDRIKDSLDKYKNSTNPLVQALIAQAKEEADLKYNMDLRVKVMQDAEARSVEQARLQRVMNSAYAEAKPLMDTYDASQRKTNDLMLEMEAAADYVRIPLKDVIGLLPKLEAGAIHAGSAVSAKATEFSRAWDTAIGNVTAGISKGLTDALTGAKGWGDAMISTFKNAASGMLQAFITGLISPLTSALGQIGGNLASVLTGGGAGGAGGLAGIFGGLGSIFGGSGAGAAGAGAATIPSGAIVSSAAAGGAAAGISGAAIAALFNPITLFMGIRALMPDRPIQNVGPDPEHVNYAFPGHDVYGNFIGDTQEYIDAQQAVADALAAATQAALDNAAATEAEALAAEQAARLSDIETELGDVRSKLGDAMIQKMDMIDQSIEASNGNISAWTKQVVDLTDNIDSNTERLSDASYWTKRYTDLISESANELKRVSDERMSIEQRIAGLTYSTEHDRLEDIISAGDTAEGVAEAQRQLAELEAAQHHSEVQARIDELAALKVQLTDVIAQQAAAQQAYEDASAAAVVRVGEEQRQLASQIMSDIRLRRSIEDNIDTEMDHVDALNAQKDALQSMMDTLGVMRQTEIEKIDATIQGLIDRGAALETERANLALLLDVSSQTADVFERLGDAFSSAASGVGLGTVSPASEGTAAQTNMDTVELLRQIRDGLDGGGDVYMDKEAVGRVLVPVINRLVTFDRMELGT